MALAISLNHDIGPVMMQFIKDFIPRYRQRVDDIPYSEELTPQELLKACGRMSPVFIILGNGSQFDANLDVIQANGLSDIEIAKEAISRARELSGQGYKVAAIHSTSLCELEAFQPRFITKH